MFSFYSTSGVVQIMFVQYNKNGALRRRKKDMHLVRNEEINAIENKNDEDFYENAAP